MCTVQIFCLGCWAGHKRRYIGRMRTLLSVWRIDDVLQLKNHSYTLVSNTFCMLLNWPKGHILSLFDTSHAKNIKLHAYIRMWSVNKRAERSGRTAKHSEVFQIRRHSIEPFRESLRYGGSICLILHSDLIPLKKQEAEEPGKSQVPPHPRLLLANLSPRTNTPTSAPNLLSKTSNCFLVCQNRILKLVT